MNVLYTLERNMYSAVFLWNVLYMLTRFSWLTVLINSSMCLWNLYLLVLFITKRGRLKFSAVIVTFSAFLSSSVSLSVLLYLFWSSVVRYIHMLDFYFFLDIWQFYHHSVSLFSSSNKFLVHFCTVWHECSKLSVCMTCHFLFFYL